MPRPSITLASYKLLWFTCFFNYADRQAIYSVFLLKASNPGTFKRSNKERSGMVSAMQVTGPIQPFDSQRKGNQEAADEHAAGMMMADMLHAVAIFGIVETLVLDLPSAFGNLKRERLPTFEVLQLLSQRASMTFPSGSC